MSSTQRLLLDLTPLDTPSGPRGIGRYIRELAQGLVRLPKEELQGIEDFLGLTSLEWSGACQVTDDIASYRGGERSAAPTEANFYRWAWRQRLALWRAAKHVNATAVHISDPHATPLFLGFAGCKRIVTCYDLVPTRFPERYMGARDGGAYIGKRIERRRYRNADLVVAISDATRDDAISLLGMPPDRIVRVHAAVDVDSWAALSTSAEAPILERFDLVGRAFLVYVGGCDWRKNTEGMMAGLAHARSQGMDLRLVWAGHLQRGHIDTVEGAARRFGVEDAVHRVGYVSDNELAVLYREAKAHLLVSRYEGFGLTVVEAMACGCPVITTDSGSLAEVVGDAALKVDPEDAAAIGEAILRVCREPELRGDLAARGRERSSLFSRIAQAKAMARVYREFFNAPERARSG